jgi:hypothetical protein
MPSTDNRTGSEMNHCISITYTPTLVCLLADNLRDKGKSRFFNAYIFFPLLRFFFFTPFPVPYIFFLSSSFLFLILPKYSYFFLEVRCSSYLTKAPPSAALTNKPGLYCRYLGRTLVLALSVEKATVTAARRPGRLRQIRARDCGPVRETSGKIAPQQLCCTGSTTAQRRISP